jgi:hypothetical protein
MSERNSGQPAGTVAEWSSTTVAEPLEMLGVYGLYTPRVVKGQNTNVEKKIRRRGWPKQFFEK